MRMVVVTVSHKKVHLKATKSAQTASTYNVDDSQHINELCVQILIL